ncbi:hypothetical protein AGABI2DRAFT_189205 [Agaricus bisporus var. bisporus H97]|uniref:hypothetical protein n=1 Tax=Agaricus bisporus var. bisporus (strain H97 / ATCC MYA-4626 / FGSC 10389) TaxID=936046 RepID=UPI00029F596A|nr:hypothetical protein AGABI2DRAFT_189205 [Agaricus bisporus var. bisporus H97]EKV50867.1 hypothetical protein AGABI2DRAFT_189205 [Agaricus bisporus var. bisporus H97]
MDDAWQSQDIAPSSGGGISIPTTDVTMSNGAAESGNTNIGGGPPLDGPRVSPPSRDRDRDRNGDAPRRSSRSRSPGRNGDDRSRKPDGGHNPGNNLHVSSLSHKVTTTDLEAAFAKVGRVKKASVMHDPHTRDSRGFGFVTMETAEEADAAITALNATDLMGKVMNVERARRGRARTPTPGRYYGPPKRNDFERPYDPRPYDSRYTRDYEDRRRGGGGGGRYDDYRGGGSGGGSGGGGGGGRDYDRHRNYDRDRDRDRGYAGGRDHDRGRHDDRRY